MAGTSPTKFRIAEITRVSFGGEYEDALRLTGDEPPTTSD